MVKKFSCNSIYTLSVANKNKGEPSRQSFYWHHTPFFVVSLKEKLTQRHKGTELLFDIFFSSSIIIILQSKLI